MRTKMRRFSEKASDLMMFSGQLMCERIDYTFRRAVPAGTAGGAAAAVLSEVVRAVLGR